MTKRSLSFGLGLCLISMPALLADDAEEPNPIIPGTPWRVHDMGRPQPPKVQVAGPVTTPPPSDAKVLFDGSNTDAWDGDWEIRDGILIVSNEQDLATKEKFGKMQLHIEWRIPAGREVDGQSGGNSGVFLMGMYEVQVMESHANVTYPDGQAGALYGQKPPLVNPALPQGEWQSYDIYFEPQVYAGDGKTLKRPALVTVVFNGVVVQNAQPIFGPTLHKQLAHYPEHALPDTGPLKLQFHGDPIEYRNIWIRPLGEYDSGK